jgi:hypothetical protein
MRELKLSVQAYGRMLPAASCGHWENCGRESVAQALLPLQTAHKATIANEPNPKQRRPFVPSPLVSERE